MPRKTGFAATIVFLGLLGLYLATLTSDHSHDVVAYSLLVERTLGTGEVTNPLLNPYHVAPQPFVLAIVALLQAVGVHVGALITFQVVGSIGGAALGALLVVRLARRTQDLALSVVAAIACGLAGGVWLFATDGECNVPALALAVAALGPALDVLEGRGGRAVAWCGVLLALACAWHLTLGLLWIAILVAAPFHGRKVLRDVVLALVLASGVLALFYVPRAVVLAQQPQGLTWAEVVSFTDEIPGGAYLLRNRFHPDAELVQALRGFAFAPSDVMHPESVTLLAPASSGAVGLLRALPIAWLLAGLVALARRPRDPALQVTALWSLGALVLYGAWAGLELDFTNFHLVPWALLGTLGLAQLAPRGGPRHVVACACAAAALLAGVANFTGLIGPRLDPASNVDRVIAERVGEATGPRDRVVVTGLVRTRLTVYVPYFARRVAVIPELYFSSRIPPEESLRRMDAAIDAARAEGAAAWALADAVEPRGASSLRHPVELVREALARRDPKPAILEPDGGVFLYALGFGEKEASAWPR